jgi:hypothetical protein
VEREVGQLVSRLDGPNLVALASDVRYELRRRITDAEATLAQRPGSSSVSVVHTSSLVVMAVAMFGIVAAAIGALSRATEPMTSSATALHFWYATLYNLFGFEPRLLFWPSTFALIGALMLRLSLPHPRSLAARRLEYEVKKAYNLLNELDRILGARAR